MDALISGVNLLSRLAGLVAALCIAVAVFVICDMVIERYVFNLTTIWQIDVVTYCVVAATFVGAPYVLQTRGHVNVDVLPVFLSPRARYWLSLLASVLALLFCVVAFYLCTKFWYESYSERWLSNTVWRSRLWIPYLAMPVGLGLLVLQYLVEFVSVATGRVHPFNLTPEGTGV